MNYLIISIILIIILVLLYRISTKETFNGLPPKYLKETNENVYNYFQTHNWNNLQSYTHLM